MEKNTNLFEYVLRMGDDSLILGHRVSEWCGHGPILEEDIALTNISLDLIGQATNLLEYAGEIEGKGRDGDAIAFLRCDREYKNLLLVEQTNGDFGKTPALSRWRRNDSDRRLRQNGIQTCAASLRGRHTRHLRPDRSARRDGLPRRHRS